MNNMSKTMVANPTWFLNFHGSCGLWGLNLIEWGMGYFQETLD